MRTIFAVSALFGLLAASAAHAQALTREYPVTTPVPPNAVALSAGVAPPPGSVALLDNMPGHRRFRAPLFPRAGWDSPMRADGEKDYDRYLVEYWRAPFLAATDMNANTAGQDQRGYVAPEPWTPKIERSRATPDQEAVFERRMQFITREVLNAAPMRNLHGASVEPDLTIVGYGQQHGVAGDGVVRGEIVLQFRLIMPSTGKNQRMPDGTIQSTYFGPTLRIALNPDFIDCAAPAQISDRGLLCLKSDARMVLATDRATTAASGTAAEPRRTLVKGAYADGRPATDIRALFVSHDRRNNASSEIRRGRMHPHDPLGRIIGAFHLIDWNDVLRRANAVE